MTNANQVPAKNGKTIAERMDDLQAELAKATSLVFVVAHATYDEMSADNIYFEFRKSLPAALDAINTLLNSIWDEASDIAWEMQKSHTPAAAEQKEATTK